MKLAARVAMLLVVLAIGVNAGAATLMWDRNTEADVKDYQIWACLTPNCVVIKNPATLQGTVSQPAVGVAPTWPIPDGQQGFVAVSARDQSLNESGLSVAVPFDVKPPAAPTNLRVQ